MTITPQAAHEESLRLAQGVRKLAYNIWWTWNPRAQNLFKTLSPEAWDKSNHNALAVLQALTPEELVANLYSKRVGKMAAEVIAEFEGYLSDPHTWGEANCPHFKKNPVAYFSAEFGMHESLPIYSGGLGILSGDHIKSASDLGLPFIGITLFYRNGYFQQQINAEGWQEETYPVMDPNHLPVELVKDAKGEVIVNKLMIAHSEVYYHAWRLNVGRATLYLLDTHRPENDLHWREITARVYGGDHTTRVCQELMLGVGGVRLLRSLGVEPTVFHLNEGHSSFLLLELLREEIKKGQTLEQAREAVCKKAIFTTHTPVPAGHDRFSAELLDHLMHSWPAKLNLTFQQFLDLGRVVPGDEAENFCMTTLALKHTRAANAVSELNGTVSRQMWQCLYPEKPVDEIPIGHITNGVHVLGWMNRVTYSFWEYNLGVEWLKKIMHPDFWNKVADKNFLSDEVIWSLRYRLKRQMIEAVRARLRLRNLRNHVAASPYHSQTLHSNALTLGFSRRFATYKRAALLFSDLDRAAALFNNPTRPLQLLFAGKAHPRDDQGKALIQQIYQISHDPRFIGKVVFVENYDIQVARYLVSGCDVWLNNPRRPLEASGTSGQKTAVHGCLNLSILDGWWREGYDGTNGFSIGEDSNPEDIAEQDRLDTENLYRAIENEVIPEYFDRDEMNIPRNWIQRIRRAMVTLIPQFNTDRMVAEYATKYYMEQK